MKHLVGGGGGGGGVGAELGKEVAFTFVFCCYFEQVFFCED